MPSYRAISSQHSPIRGRPAIVDKPLSWFLGSLVPWFLGSLVPWFLGSLVPWFLGSLVPWFLGSLVPWFLGSLVPYRASMNPMTRFFARFGRTSPVGFPAAQALEEGKSHLGGIADPIACDPTWCVHQIPVSASVPLRNVSITVIGSVGGCAQSPRAAGYSLK
jgi:hypothetical protein